MALQKTVNTLPCLLLFFFFLSPWKITAGIKRISGVIKLSSLSGGAAAKWEGGFFWQVFIVF